MKLLCCLFCYNRPSLFQNALESFLEFGPPCDLLIVDDGSQDPAMIENMRRAEAKPNVTVIRQPRGGSQSEFGGIQRNQNTAFDHAEARGYSHTYFIHDDMQFAWRDEQLEETVQRIFDLCPKASMVRTTFEKGLFSHTPRSEYLPDIGAWRRVNSGFVDTGVFSLARIRAEGFRCLSNETINHQFWMDRGYRTHMVRMPSLAYVPSSEYYAFMRGEDYPPRPPRKYYVKPLSSEMITHLRGRDSKTVPVHEDYVFPWGWRCLSPYRLDRRRLHYFRQLLRYVRKNRGLAWPRLAWAK